MKKYLPSKKFVRFIGIILALSAIVWLVPNFFLKKEIFHSKNLEAKVTTNSDNNGQDFYQKDSDGDGVYDWEEGLWGTDPYKKDSNGDGITDADEIASQKKQIQNRNSSNNVEDTEGGTNQTNLLAKQILSTASLVQQQGGLSNSDLTSVSNSFNQAISNTNIVDKYSVSDLALTSIDIALYKEVLAIAFQPLLNSEIDELNAIYTFTSSKNPQDSAQDIDKLIAMYKDLSERILKVEAPYGAAGIHLKLVNETDKLSTAFINIRHLTDDPVVSTIGFRQYQKYYDELESTLNSLQGYFTKNGII